MSEIHALSGAYAVDALDDIERAQFERHLAECPDCRSEVDSLREAAALLAETTVTAPSAGLRDRVLADIAEVRPLPPAGATATALEPRRRRRAVTFLVAAAAAIAIGTGGIVWQQVNDDGPTDPYSRSSRPSDAQEFTQTLPGGATATVVRSEELNEAVLVTHDMPAAPEGHAYALWLQHDDVMVPAGIMPSRLGQRRCCSAATRPRPTAPASPSRPPARSRPSPATTSSPSSPSTPRTT